MAEIKGWGIIGNALMARKCVFSTIALDSDQADAFASDQWVRVDRIFDLQQTDGKPVPIVSEPHIKPAEAPSVHYLF